MEKDDFSSAIKAMGYTRERFAQIVAVKSPTTVENWASGDVKVPGPVATLVEYMLARPEARSWFEERMPPGSGAQRADKKRRAKSRANPRDCKQPALVRVKTPTHLSIQS